MKIAVVGAGIFGTTIAIKLAQAGYDVELFEKNGEILSAASGINQYRLHRGYHYPRSKETALSSKHSEQSFREEYADAVSDENEHYYVLAKEKSLISGEDFLKFCRECELEHEKVDLEHIHPHMAEFTIKGKESILDPLKLREIVKKKIREQEVKVFLNQPFDPDQQIDEYDTVVNATYANSNWVLEKYPKARRQYQFELCEKPVLKLPDNFKKKSIVVLDGPFFCIDPYSDTGYHVMGNVVHAIHASNIGLYPEIPEEFAPLMNRGIIKNPKITNIDKFIKSAAEFMPELRDAKHIGSMYTVRTVLPYVEATDERPTIVSRLNDPEGQANGASKIIQVFSGKIGNCVEAANEVLRLVQQSRKHRERIRRYTKAFQN
ncbi:MAG: FAD-dependent oxidoreductase [Patescibacteria group bacterium]